MMYYILYKIGADPHTVASYPTFSISIPHSFHTTSNVVETPEKQSNKSAIEKQNRVKQKTINVMNKKNKHTQKLQE